MSSSAPSPYCTMPTHNSSTRLTASQSIELSTTMMEPSVLQSTNDKLLCTDDLESSRISFPTMPLTTGDSSLESEPAESHLFQTPQTTMTTTTLLTAASTETTTTYSNKSVVSLRSASGLKRSGSAPSRILREYHGRISREEAEQMVRRKTEEEAVKRRGHKKSKSDVSMVVRRTSMIEVLEASVYVDKEDEVRHMRLSLQDITVGHKSTYIQVNGEKLPKASVVETAIGKFSDCSVKLARGKTPSKKALEHIQVLGSPQNSRRRSFGRKLFCRK